MSTVRQKNKMDKLNLAVIVLTDKGFFVAEKIQKNMECDIFIPDKLGLVLEETKNHTVFAGKVAELTAELWHKYRGIVFICASGIAVRSIAPHIKSKQTDPAVVVVDEGARFSISLLSGHWGDANGLAGKISCILECTPVITTASDGQEKPAFDVIARKYDMKMKPFGNIVMANAALVNNRRVMLYSEYDFPDVNWPANVSCIHNVMEIYSQYDAGIAITNKQLQPRENLLQLIPGGIVAGIGCRRNTPAHNIIGAIESAFELAGIDTDSLALIASIELKSDEAGILQAADALKIPVKFFTSEELSTVDAISNSSFVKDITGCECVCEQASMFAAGKSRLLLGKTVVNSVTIALSEPVELKERMNEWS